MGLLDRTGYSYVVRSVDLANGAEDANLVEQRGAPTGVETTQTLSETFEGPGGGDEACLGSALAVTSITDPATPAASSGFWYLVRGGNTCGEGPYGLERRNGAPGTPRSSTTCP